MVRAVARKRDGERRAATTGWHPFKGGVMAVGDGSTEAPHGDKGTRGGGAIAGWHEAGRSLAAAGSGGAHMRGPAPNR
jgi:hypothetical protein